MKRTEIQTPKASPVRPRISIKDGFRFGVGFALAGAIIKTVTTFIPIVIFAIAGQFSQ